MSLRARCSERHDAFPASKNSAPHKSGKMGLDWSTQVIGPSRPFRPTEGRMKNKRSRLRLAPESHCMCGQRKLLRQCRLLGFFSVGGVGLGDFEGRGMMQPD
jgi:hypothetical protein